MNKVVNMVTREKIRWILTTITTVVGVPLGALATANVGELAKQKGWDQNLANWWPDIMAVISALDSMWAILIFGFLFGATLMMWVVRFIPEGTKLAEDSGDTSETTSMVIDFEQPKYTLYDPRIRFTLLEAACLWGEVTPVSRLAGISFHPEAKAAYQLLGEAIRDGRLPSYSKGRLNQRTQTRDPKPVWELDKADLIAFSKSINQEPAFLFPKARSWMR